jgi:hypothetical protein
MVVGPPQVGQRVKVYWGLDEVEGRVVDVYGQGSLARARVEIPVLGPDGEELDTETFSLPFEALHV